MTIEQMCKQLRWQMAPSFSLIADKLEEQAARIKELEAQIEFGKAFYESLPPRTCA